LGKYSKALEKAKNADFVEEGPSVGDIAIEADLQLDEPVTEDILQPEEAGTESQAAAPAARAPVTQPPLPEEDVLTETSGWDRKLKEIVNGNSKHVAENIKMLRTKIFYPESGVRPRTIVVTSAVPGEGKSFICANLGVSIAQGIGNEALLVDADLRRPSLSGYFGLENKRGLSDFLQSGTPVEQLIKPTSMPNLSVLSSGDPPPNPAELLDSKNMVSLIRNLVEQNPKRLIIFDSPPIQAASETDVLAKKVDSLILVFRWGFARKEHARQLVELLDKDKVIGVVFNAFQMTRLESKLQGYYYGYKDYYYKSSYSKYYDWQP
jgi:capsular exopolysaccharide synthesis family protein